MIKHGKFWGNTSALFHKNNVEINRIEGSKGGYSSEHMHKAKFNMFYVESGKLCITVWKDPSGKPDETILLKGDITVVPPEVYHKFKVLEDCVAFEVYWTELREDDIIRKNSGGVK